ncbi:MAG: lipoprotein N-acyltransferase Lnb domain-containing protein [Aequorivita sp.]
MIKNYILFLLLLLSVSAKAQFGSLSPAGEISILTIGPGAELYDKFGHSAFRIKDSLSGVDVVFNYGVYDFDTPNFYTKFAQGKLLYELGISDYGPFYRSYVAQNRWVKEQVLNLTQEEKQGISDFLWNNGLPQNKKYKYDFFYDNCATKIRDVMWEVLGNKLEFHEDHIKEALTFRQLIQQNLQANTWGSMGIDIALGAVIDRKAKPIEYQFLPEYVYEGAANAEITRNNETVDLVKSTKVLYENKPTESGNNFLLSPLFILGLIGLLIIYITYRDYKRNARSRYLDVFIFSYTGLIGIFLLLLWFATDHSATANNYNLLWAFPISLFFIWAILKRDIALSSKRYVLLLILLLVLLTIHWITGVQVFAIALLPLLVALAIRYFYLMYFIKKQR